ncbi:MAG: sensor histidine kinase, partial [Puniceicoccales bacterium]
MLSIIAIALAVVAAALAVVFALGQGRANKRVAELEAKLAKTPGTTEGSATTTLGKPASVEEAEATTTGFHSQGLFATLSHELRTPLNGVLGMAQLIKQDHPDERIETLESCAFHMQSVLHALVNFSKIQSNWKKLPEYREWVNLHDLLEQSKKEITSRARTRGLSITM